MHSHRRDMKFISLELLYVRGISTDRFVAVIGKFSRDSQRSKESMPTTDKHALIHRPNREFLLWEIHIKENVSMVTRITHSSLQECMCIVQIFYTPPPLTYISNHYTPNTTIPTPIPSKASPRSQSRGRCKHAPLYNADTKKFAKGPPPRAHHSPKPPPLHAASPAAFPSVPLPRLLKIDIIPNPT